MIHRFVILEHDHPFLHWDFLLESGDILTSFRLLAFPQCGVWIDSQPLPDHRTLYLEYEGKLSGNRGSVKRIQSGRYSMTASLDEARQQYSLIDCDLGTLAICHQSENGSVQWWFE